MNRTAKIVLAILGVSLLVCCIGTFAVIRFAPQILGGTLEGLAEGAVADTPEEAAAVGQEILTYDTPAGYREEMAVEMLGIKMVMIAPEGDGQMVIMLMEFPEAMAGSEAQMRRQMEDALEDQGIGAGGSMAEVGTRDVVIGGEMTTLTIVEGTGENGEAFRQVSGPFSGGDGALGMVMIMGPVAGWDDRAVDEFLDSMR